MKLIIQIPCLNEAKTLPVTLKDIPKQIEGVDEVEVLVIDDGSTDNTSDIARENGVQHILRLNRNTGLAYAFKLGIEESLRLGADIIINTDADNQYDGSSIPDLIKPIINKEADIIIGNREILKAGRQGFIKGVLQFIGSWVVSRLSRLKIKDVTSGFRAFSREAAMKLNIASDFSYTLETIIQAGEKGLVVKDVPVKTNGPLRKSRLFTSIFHYVQRSTATIIKVYVAYEGFRVFVTTGAILVSLGVLFVLRFLYFYVIGLNPSGHIQSLIIASILITVGFLVTMLGLLTDLVCSTRRIAEDILTKVRELEVDKKTGNPKPPVVIDIKQEE